MRVEGLGFSLVSSLQCPFRFSYSSKSRELSAGLLQALGLGFRFEGVGLRAGFRVSDLPVSGMGA